MKTQIIKPTGGNWVLLAEGPISGKLCNITNSSSYIYYLDTAGLPPDDYGQPLAAGRQEDFELIAGEKLFLKVNNDASTFALTTWASR